MIHRATITRFDPKGELFFTLGGHPFHALHSIPFKEAEGLIIEGKTYPLELTVRMSKDVEYLNEPSEGLEVSGCGGNCDIVRVKGRITDYLEHDVIRLDGKGSVRVQLRLPQQATDYRQGSWLMAEGALHASIPSPDHDEAGLIGSIVE